MSLLRDIQTSIIESEQSIAPILLKLRLLAARLGSSPLEEWVKYESEGYPEGVDIPDYRRIPVSYRGTFFGSYGSSISDVPISGSLIEKYAGEKWVNHQNRQSVAAIDDLVKSSSEGGTLRIDASDLILCLQGKVYKDYACNSVVGTVSRTSLVEIQHAVRVRVLELTIQLEKSVPVAAEVSLEKPGKSDMGSAEKVTQIYNQTIHGDVGNLTSVTNYGEGANLSVCHWHKMTKTAFVEFLVSKESAKSRYGRICRYPLDRGVGERRGTIWSKGERMVCRKYKKSGKRYMESWRFGRDAIID